MDQLDAWLEVRQPVLDDKTLGDSIDAVEELLQKHDDFEKTVLAQEERFNAIGRMTLVLLPWLCIIQLVVVATMLQYFPPGRNGTDNVWTTFSRSLLM